MSHTTTLFFLELFLLGFVGLLNGARPTDGLLAGVGLGSALNIRPMSAVAVAAPFLLYGGFCFAARVASRSDRARLARFCLVCLVAAASCALLIGGLLAYNEKTNGDPLLFGYEVLHGKESLPGFGNTGWWKTPHTPRRGLTWTLENFNALNSYLLGLPLPSLCFAFLGLAWGRPRIWDGLLLGSMASLALAYSFYWYHDWALGPRFLYSATGPLLLLTARGLVSLPAFLRSLPPSGRQALPIGTVAVALLLAFGYGLLVNLPVLTAFYSRNYADGNPEVLAGIDEQELAGAVVFTAAPYYPSVFPRNDPLLRGPVIYAQDFGLAKSLELMRRFPERRAFRLVAGEDYRLVPYTAENFTEPLTYPLVPGSPLTVELTTSQASFFAGGFWRDQQTGELGGGWKHHDQLLITSRSPGAQVGLLILAREPERRSVLVALSRAPEFGIVEIHVPGSSRTVDLHGTRMQPELVLLEGIEFPRGLNQLSIAVVGKNEKSTSYGMGVDYVSCFPEP